MLPVSTLLQTLAPAAGARGAGGVIPPNATLASWRRLFLFALRPWTEGQLWLQLAVRRITTYAFVTANPHAMEFNVQFPDPALYDPCSETVSRAGCSVPGPPLQVFDVEYLGVQGKR